MNKKIVYFDIDGTIVSDDEKHMILSSTANAIKKLRENGVYTVINTGRTYFNVDDFIKKLGFDGYICGCGTYVEFNSKILEYKTVESVAECMKIVDIVRKCDAAPIYERCDTFYYDSMTRSIGWMQDLKNIYKNQGKNTSHDVSDEGFSFDKFCIWYDEKTDLEYFRSTIENKFDYIDRGYGFAEMVPCGYSKGNAIEKLNNYLGINKVDSYAAGDSLNDLPMLNAVGNPIVVGKKSPLTEYGFYNSDDFYEDGLVKALEYFKLI